MSPARRIANRILSSLVALVAAAGGVLIAVEIVVAAFGRRPWVLPHDEWYRSARINAWDDAAPRWIFIALFVAGLLLLGLQLAKRRPPALALGPGGPPTDIGRRSLERALVRSATEVDGVASAKVKVGSDRAEVVAVTNRRQAGDIRSRVASAVEDRIRRLGLARVPAVRVKVETRGDK